MENNNTKSKYWKAVNTAGCGENQFEIDYLKH